MLPQKTNCLGTDELQLYYEFGARSAVYDGTDICFNNKKYGMPRNVYGNYNVLDTPYTIFKNCYNMEF